MPDDDPKPHVKAHLDKRNVAWKDLKPKTRKALNEFSADEITKLDALGTALEDDKVPTNVRVTAVH
jgi:hypothetical protein